MIFPNRSHYRRFPNISNDKRVQEIEELEQKILDLKSRLDIALNEEATTRDELNQFSSFKAQMKKNGVDILDNPKFMGAVVGARSLGFDPRAMVEKLSNIHRLEIDQNALAEKVKFLEKKSQGLQLECSNLEKETLVHSYRISIYQDLESMGRGIKELKLLWNTIKEIAAVNNISADRASEKFFSDVIQHYDDKLGFEGEIHNLKSEIQKNELIRFQISGTIALLNSIILNQFDQIQAVSGFVEFSPLAKAAKGETVPKDQLKNAVIKAIDILIRTDPTDRSNNALNAARLFLLEDIQKSGDIA